MDRKNTEEKTVKKSAEKIAPVKKKALSITIKKARSSKSSIFFDQEEEPYKHSLGRLAHLIACGENVQCSTCLFYVEENGGAVDYRVICSSKPLIPMIVPQQGTNVRDLNGNPSRSGMAIQFFPCSPYRSPLFCEDWQRKPLSDAETVKRGSLETANLFDTRKAEQDLVNEAEKMLEEEIDKNTPS